MALIMNIDFEDFGELLGVQIIKRIISIIIESANQVHVKH